MATSMLVPLSEYLSTSYSPDREWIDGEVRERNMGEGSHGEVQGFFVALFRNHGREWGVRTLLEQRVQTSATHYRVPDVGLTLRNTPSEQIVRTPPLLCVEILSKDDRMSEMHSKVEDYLRMGVEMVWIVDPWRRKAFTASVGSAGNLIAADMELAIPGTPIRVAIAEIFASLDDFEAGMIQLPQ